MYVAVLDKLFSGNEFGGIHHGTRRGAPSTHGYAQTRTPAPGVSGRFPLEESMNAEQTATTGEAFDLSPTALYRVETAPP